MNELLSGLKHTFYIYSRPFDGFWIMKSEKKGNLKAAFTLLALLIVTTVLRTLSTGYLFASVTLANFSAWMLAIGIAVLCLLYCVSNWALTTLLDGNGSISYIFMSLMYSFSPLIICNIPVAILSHILVLEEAAFIQFINVVCILWILFMLLVSNSSIHEYSMTKSIATFIGTLLVMVAVAVLVILFFNLLQQVYVWIKSIIQEILFRL